MKPKRITLKDIAKEAGVTAATVSFALKNDPRITEETRLKVQKIAQKLGYQSNPVLRSLMSELRKGSSNHYRSTIGFAHTEPEAQPWKHITWIRNTYQKIIERAHSFGYQVDEVRLNQPELTPKRLETILATKQIRGLIVAVTTPNFPPPLLDWKRYTCISIMHQLAGLQMNQVRTDIYGDMMLALDAAADMGYCRVGFFTQRRNEELNSYRRSAALCFRQQETDTIGNIRPLLVDDLSQVSAGMFRAWYKEHKPDIILTVNIKFTRHQLQQLGLKIPRDIGIINLGASDKNPHETTVITTSGAGSMKAVEQLDRQLNHNEYGLPADPTSLLLKGRMFYGNTTKVQRNKAKSTQSSQKSD